MDKTTLTGHDVVARWFEALTAGDGPGTVALFSPTPVIRNAANPELCGPSAADRLLADLLARTESREFDLVASAAGANYTLAWWRARLVFRAGAIVAGSLVATAFACNFSGVDVFRFDAEGRIVELDIIHETTTVALAAAAHRA